MQRFVIFIAGVLFVGAALYIGGYYFVTAEWPWQTDESAADMVLQHAYAAPRPVATAVRATATQASVASQGKAATPTQPVTALPAATPTAELPTLQSGTTEEGTIHSSYMSSDMPYIVYLPPGYNDSANAQRRYPTAYLLHGAPGNYRDWIQAANADKTADALISLGRIPPMILVMPEGHTTLAGDSEWANGTPPAEQAESYMVKEVVPYIDAHYRTISDPAHRAIGGLSTGGYGGVNMTLHHPDVFGTAWSLSGNYVAARTILQQTLFKDDTSKAYNSPIAYVAHLKHPQQVHVYLAVGASDRLDNTFNETKEMEQALVSAGVPHQVDYDPGAHSWHFWQDHLINALQYFASTLPNA